MEKDNIPEQPTEKQRHEMPITGRFDQYRSSYWAAKLAAFGIRYPFRSLAKAYSEQENLPLYKKHAYSGVVGLIMGSVTGFFALRTWKDMHTIFKQPLAWEFNKPEEDVGFTDFWKSKNTMVQQTLSNYLRYNFRRVGIDVAFFLPLIVFPFLKKKIPYNGDSFFHRNFHPDKWHFETGADWGLGANAAYLLSDVMARKMTPFESLQTAIDHKINHTDHAGDQMTAVDLLDIYERHADKGSIPSFKAQRGTPEWERSMVIFDRMADLMNQTYGNAPTEEKADFGFPKFIYLVGNKLIDPQNIKQTLAYIEVANRYDIPALKQVVDDVKNGVELATALTAFPIPTAEDVTVVKTEGTARKFAPSITAQGWAKPAVSADKGFVERLGDKAPAAQNNMSV